MRFELLLILTVGCGSIVTDPTDAGPAGKGGTSSKAPVDVDSGPPPVTSGCGARGHLFCEDFDRLSTLQGAFDTTLLMGAAALRRNLERATSVPAALEAHAEPGAEAAVVKTFTVPDGIVTARVDLYAFVSVMPELSNVPIVTLHADPDDISIALGGGVFGWSGLVVRPIASSSSTYGTTGTFVAGTWAKLRLELTLGASTIESFTTTLNAEAPTTWSVAIPRPTTLVLLVGPRPGLKGGATHVTIDDVTFDFVKK